jgi:hypothetical protein
MTSFKGGLDIMSSCRNRGESRARMASLHQHPELAVIYYFEGAVAFSAPAHYVSPTIRTLDHSKSERRIRQTLSPQ